VYLHIDAADLTGLTDLTGGVDGAGGRGGTGVGGGRVERLGAATLVRLRDWLQRAETVTIRPVLDLARADVVDTHDPPGWMRESVILRDGRCVFPGCRVDARGCDVDHIESYRPPGDGGPPGQTSPDALACLCRRHHRLKTFTAWTYHPVRTRTGARAYAWTSPHGHHYRTHPDPNHPRR